MPTITKSEYVIMLTERIAANEALTTKGKVALGAAGALGAGAIAHHYGLMGHGAGHAAKTAIENAPTGGGGGAGQQAAQEAPTGGGGPGWKTYLGAGLGAAALGVGAHYLNKAHPELGQHVSDFVSKNSSKAAKLFHALTNKGGDAGMPPT